MDLSKLAASIADPKKIPGVEAFPGAIRRTLLAGENLMLCLYDLKKGSVIPKHHHPHEQGGMVISGKMKMTIGGETHVVSAGQAYFMQGDQEHTIEVLEDTVALDAFSPPREDYLHEITDRG